MIGEVVGNYRITAQIATGGMGVVYRAEHTLIGKAAAIKVLRREYSENRDITERFFREAQATTSIRHPGIIDIYDFGYYANERAFIVMELLEGETLKERLRTRGVVPPEVATRLIRSVAGAVGAAHDQGVIHRDLKPDNIFLVPDPDMPDGERVKVLDFGLAKLTDAHNASSGTQAGILLGTPAYMAPEQCAGEGQIDLRADIYALGCILFQLVCGRPPFVQTNSMARVLMAHLNEPPPLPRTINGAVPESLERIIMVLLAKAPEQRFQNMAALRTALDACAQEVAQEVSEIPVAVLVEPTAAHAGGGSQSGWSPASGAYVSQASTLGASAGQVVQRYPDSQSSGVSLSPHASVATGSAARDSARRMATHASHPSGSHGSGVRAQGASSGREPGRRGPRRLGRWIVGGVASVLLGMGLVLALAPGRRAPVATPAASPETETPSDHGAVRPEAADQPAVLAPPGDTADAGTDAAAASEPSEIHIDMGEDVIDPSPGGEAGTEAASDGESGDEAAVTSVRVHLNLEPAAATVVVDSEVRTDNPLVLTPRDKAYRIEIRAKGFETKKRWLEVDGDRPTRSLRVVLEPTKIDLDL